LAHLIKSKNVSSPLRARAGITSPVWVLRHLSGKARGLRILLVWKGRATLPDGMDRRPNRGCYSCASPWVTTTFCISPCTPISYTAVLRPTAVSRLKKGVRLRQGYGRQASGIFGPLSCSRTRVRSARQAYSAEVATKAGSACGLAERAFLNIPNCSIWARTAIFSPFAVPIPLDY
jgi:hypothetical protein